MNKGFGFLETGYSLWYATSTPDRWASENISGIVEGKSDNRKNLPSRLSHRSPLATDLSANVAADQYQLSSTPATAKYEVWKGRKFK